MNHLRDQWRIAAGGRLYHFTDNPRFTIDPTVRPRTRLGPPTGVSALYVTDDPWAWWQIWGSAQGRKFVAEIKPIADDWRRYIRSETQAPDPPEDIIILAMPGATESFQVIAVVPVSVSKIGWPAAKWKMPKGYQVSDWAKKATKYVFDVSYATNKDTLMAGEIVAGTSRVAIDADSEVEARLLAEQMVGARGKEPTGVRRVAGSDGSWRRTRFGWLSSDGRYFLEAGTRASGMGRGGHQTWMIWVKAKPGEVDFEEDGSAYSVRDGDPVTRQDELTGEGSGGDWYLHRADAIGLDEAKETAASL